MTIPSVSLILGTSAVIALSGHGQPQPAKCPRCEWRPPSRTRSVNVRTFDELARAIKTVPPDTEILLEPGEYKMTDTLEISTPGLTLRARDGRAEGVVLKGQGMTGAIGVGVGVNANRVTLADLTIGSVRFHAIQVRGERDVQQLMIHGVRLHDAGQQLLKGSRAGNRGARDVTVACSRFWYTTTAPSDYTDGVDVLTGTNWEVRDNEFERIVGPATKRHAAGPAILFWSGSRNITISRNVIRNSFRGIAVGLQGPQGGAEVVGATVHSNVVWNRERWADEGIEVNSAEDVLVEHNTVFVEGSLPWSIGVRYERPGVTVRNNLSNRKIIMRDGGRAALAGNVVSALGSWFRAPADGDLHLLAGTPAIDAGATTEVSTDFDRHPRVHGKAPDAGAFEWQP